MRFAKDGVDVSYFSLVTTVGTPQDVTLQEIRVESFFPADAATAAHRLGSLSVREGGYPAGLPFPTPTSSSGPGIVSVISIAFV